MSEKSSRREERKKSIDTIVAAKELEIAGYKAKLATAQAALEAAQAESIKCYADADTKGYHKAQDEVRNNTDAVDMFRNKIEQIEKTPYISEKEFQDAANTIYAELNDEVEAAGAEIAELVKRIVEIGGRTSESIKKWESYVLDVQRNIRKDRCNIITTDGRETEVPDNARRKTFKNRDFVPYIDTVRNNPYINKYLGEIKKENVIWGNAR